MFTFDYVIMKQYFTMLHHTDIEGTDSCTGVVNFSGFLPALWSNDRDEQRNNGQNLLIAHIEI